VRLGAGNAVKGILGTILGFFSVPKVAINGNKYIGIPFANLCTIHKARILVEIWYNNPDSRFHYFLRRGGKS
jgi:hypothetical protein